MNHPLLYIRGLLSDLLIAIGCYTAAERIHPLASSICRTRPALPADPTMPCAFSFQGSLPADPTMPCAFSHGSRLPADPTMPCAVVMGLRR